MEQQWGAIPQAVVDYAYAACVDYDYYRYGEEPSGETSMEITAIDRMSTGTAAENHEILVYEVDCLVTNISLPSDFVTTEYSLYLVVLAENSTIAPLGYVDARTVDEVYGTPEMLAEYGDNKYTALAMETYAAYRENQTLEEQR